VEKATLNSTTSKRFLPYYWEELKKLLSPAGPLVVCAVYSFVLIFPRYHRRLFKLDLFGGQARFAEKMALDGLWFVLLPVIVILILSILSWLFPPTKKFFPQHRLRHFGFRLGRGVGWRDAAIFLAIMFPFVCFAVFQPSFAKTYPLFRLARTSLRIFIIWEGVHLLHMFGWEFLNRGFLLFGLEEKMGNWAILATALPFALLHIGKPELEAYGSFIAAIALGWLALRARSFIPGAFLHWGVALTLDILAVVRAGGFG
jgi:membrane protease YdiL (CAAX protease family)